MRKIDQQRQHAGARKGKRSPRAVWLSVSNRRHARAVGAASLAEDQERLTHRHADRCRWQDRHAPMAPARPRTCTSSSIPQGMLDLRRRDRQQAQQQPCRHRQHATNYVDQALSEATSGKAVSARATQAYGCSVKYPVGPAASRSRTVWRREPESNRPQRICNPVHNRFAIAPWGEFSHIDRRACDTPVLQTTKGSISFPLRVWSGERVSNSRPQPWQGCALPTELFPRGLRRAGARRRREL